MTSSLCNTTTRDLPGSIHLPPSYHLHTTAFDAKHIQSPRAKQARADIDKFLHNINLDPLSVSTSVWNNSTVGGKTINGKIEPSWTEEQTTVDNRKYAAMETQRLVEISQHRMYCIRNGIDYNTDPLALHDRWNVSTHVPEPPARSLHNQNDPELRHGLRMCSTGATGDVLYVRDDRPTLVQQQAVLSIQQQQAKMMALEERRLVDERQRQQQQLSSNYRWDKLPRKQQYHNDVDIKELVDRAGESVRDEYSRDVLQQYIEQKTNDDADSNMLDDMFSTASSASFDRTGRSRTRTSHAPPPRFISPRRTTLSASTKLHTTQPSMLNAAVTARTLDVLTLSPDRQHVPYVTRAHNGAYEYNASARRHEWTCCRNKQRDCLGCIQVADHSKERVMKTGRTLGDKLWSTIRFNAPNINDSSVGGTVVRYEHTGAYGVNNATGERFWSCCMSGDGGARGCKCVTVSKETVWAFRNS